MSIFTSVEEHDYAFEHRLMRQKFDVMAGDFDHKWQVIELKPKFGYQSEYAGCRIMGIQYLTSTLFGRYKPFWFKENLTADDWMGLEKEVLKVIKRRKINELIFPVKVIKGIEDLDPFHSDPCEYIPTTMYVVNEKEMSILGEKVCSWVSCRYQQIDDTKDSKQI